jgi:hypothetical protein
VLPANGVPGAPSAHRGSPGLTSRHRRALTHLPLLKRAWGRNVHSRIGSGMCKIAGARDGRLGCANERVPRPEAWGFQLFGAASRTRTTRGGLPSPSRGRQTPWPSVPRATPRRRTTTKTEAQKAPLSVSRHCAHQRVMSTSLVSGRNKSPTTKLMAATTTGYQRPE